MIDQEIERLGARDRDARLDRLEQDIWRRERIPRAAAMASRRLASCQVLILSLSVISAGTMGAIAAAHTVPPPPPGWIGVSARLAPTSLLLGTRP